VQWWKLSLTVAAGMAASKTMFCTKRIRHAGQVNFSSLHHCLPTVGNELDDVDQQSTTPVRTALQKNEELRWCISEQQRR